MQDEKMVIVYPGIKSLDTMTVRELAELKVQVEKYERYITKLIRNKLQ